MTRREPLLLLALVALGLVITYQQPYSYSTWWMETSFIGAERFRHVVVGARVERGSARHGADHLVAAGREHGTHDRLDVRFVVDEQHALQQSRLSDKMRQ